VPLDTEKAFEQFTLKTVTPAVTTTYVPAPLVMTASSDAPGTAFPTQLAGLLKPVPSPDPLHVIVAAWPAMRLANRKRKYDLKNFIAD
jgi:hypothetical protein